jgi:hypothetical protein
LYASTAELATIVAAFLADGLRSGERCWYVASGKETDPIRAALQNINVDVRGETARKALTEALLKCLFANCRAIGLCFYNRERMPLAVIDGALATHPITGSDGRCRPNRHYDANTVGLSAVDDADVLLKLEQLDRSDDSDFKRQ